MSTQLGLICVLCKNVSKSVSAIEKTNSSPREFFQDHQLNIDGKVPQRIWRVAPNSFQDHLSKPHNTMAKYICTKTPFKTMNVDGITVIRKTGNTSYMAKNRSRETSFKTMGKSGRKVVSFQDMVDEVSKAVSFKTIKNDGTKSASFQTMEDTHNRPHSFKIFNDWVKARTTKCDTALKDALSFISGKALTQDREKDPQEARPAPVVRSNPNNSEAGSWQTNPQ